MDYKLCVLKSNYVVLEINILLDKLQVYPLNIVGFLISSSSIELKFSQFGVDFLQV